MMGKKRKRPADLSQEEWLAKYGKEIKEAKKSLEQQMFQVSGISGSGLQQFITTNVTHSTSIIPNPYSHLPGGSPVVAFPPQDLTPASYDPVAAPVLAYRAWRLQRQEHLVVTRDMVAKMRAADEQKRWEILFGGIGTRLAPLSVGGPWEPIEKATCQAHRVTLSASSWAIPTSPSGQLAAKIENHITPDPACTCGLWAYKEPGQAVLNSVAVGSADVVLGQVEFWGKIVQTTHGYRAEYGRVKEVELSSRIHRREEVAQELADYYGCKVILP